MFNDVEHTFSSVEHTFNVVEHTFNIVERKLFLGEATSITRRSDKYY